MTWDSGAHGQSFRGDQWRPQMEPVEPLQAHLLRCGRLVELFRIGCVQCRPCSASVRKASKFKSNQMTYVYLVFGYSIQYRQDVERPLFCPTTTSCLWLAGQKENPSGRDGMCGPSEAAIGIHDSFPFFTPSIILFLLVHPMILTQQNLKMTPSTGSSMSRPFRKLSREAARISAVPACLRCSGVARGHFHYVLLSL